MKKLSIALAAIVLMSSGAMQHLYASEEIIFSNPPKDSSVTRKEIDQKIQKLEKEYRPVTTETEDEVKLIRILPTEAPKIAAETDAVQGESKSFGGEEVVTEIAAKEAGIEREAGESMKDNEKTQETYAVDCMETLPTANVQHSITAEELQKVRDTLLQAKKDLQQDLQARKDLASVNSVFSSITRSKQVTDYAIVEMLKKIAYAAETVTSQNLLCYVLAPAATKVKFSEASAAAFYYELGNFYRKASRQELAEDAYSAALAYYENEDYYDAYIHQLIDNAKYSEAKKVATLYIDWLKTKRPLAAVKKAKALYQALTDYVDTSELLTLVNIQNHSY